jgi:hypothetical protein
VLVIPKLRVRSYESVKRKLVAKRILVAVAAADPALCVAPSTLEVVGRRVPQNDSL